LTVWRVWKIQYPGALRDAIRGNFYPPGDPHAGSPKKNQERLNA